MNLILDHGADVDAMNQQGYTALLTASHEGRMEAVRLLIAHGANINAQRDNGQTALHRTAEWGRPKVMQALLDAGADFTIRDDTGKTALDIARDNFNPLLPSDVATRRRECETVMRKAMADREAHIAD